MTKMQPHERRFVLDELASSEARLLQLVEGLTLEQWNFRETSERWSIAENIEHVIVLEDFILEAIRNALERPAEPEKRTLATGKEDLVRSVGESRGAKIKARAAALPTGRWPDTTALIGALRHTRARTVAFAAETRADLRGHFFPHVAFGDIDCYQWLVVLSQHGFRHALQIEQIMSDPSYPRS